MYNHKQISTHMKKSILCLMASLLIGGAAIAQESAYVRAHDNNMPVVAQVVLDEIPVTSNGWTLKAYIGEDQRGEAEIQTDLDNTYWIQVYYSTETESTNTPVTFTITDGTDEYTSTTTLNTLAEGYGTPSTPQVIEFASAVIQTVDLDEGWNWFSTYIEMDGVDGLAMLKQSLGANGIYIQCGLDYTQSFEYDGETNWWGSLDDVPMTNEAMYMIQVSTDCTVTLEGQLADPAAHPITINPGWNWIGYPCNQTMTIEDAFASIAGDGDVIQQGLEYAQAFEYEGEIMLWGTLAELTPGKGYMYYSNSQDVKTLTFGTTSKAKRSINLPK